MNAALLADSIDAIARLAGRLHPVIVHFPIALLITAAAIELVRLTRRKPPASDSALACIVLGAIGAGAAAGAGWLNADYESHSDALASTLTLHRWLGVATACTAALVLVLALAARSRPRARGPYTLALIGAAALVGTTGHFGGTMVHGEGYLWEALSPTDPGEGGGTSGAAATLPARPPPPGTTLTVDFNRDLRPLFEARCIECHGPRKRKAGLRLDDPGRIFARAESEWVVVPGEPDASEIVRRLELPDTDDDHMPPKGDRVPRETIDHIRRWIAEGAYWTDSPRTAAVRERASPPVAPIRTPSSADGSAAAALRALRAKGARIEPVAQGSADLDANLGLAGTAITDDDLAHLEAIGPNVVSLDLSRTGVTDSGIARSLRAGAFPRLTHLNLTDTAITDAAIESLAALPSLAVLNLVGTGVSDPGAAVMARSPSLVRIYAWRSAITAEGAAALRAARPDLTVELDGPSLGAPDSPPDRPR